MVARQRRNQGFTLLELIVVVAIIGILATIVMPNLRSPPLRANEAVLMTNLHTLRDVLERYHGDKGHYPLSLEDLVETGYLRDVPLDPITKSRETWVVELEELDPELPPAETEQGDEGPGIIDVHSGSDRLSLDGTPTASGD